MKRLFVFVFAVVILGSCTKQEALPSIDPDLVGSWHHDTNNNYLYFYSNGVSHSYEENGVMHNYGTYSAENNTIAFQGGGIDGVWSYSISGETLTIEECLTTFNPGALIRWYGTYTKQ